MFLILRKIIAIVVILTLFLIVIGWALGEVQFSWEGETGAISCRYRGLRLPSFDSQLLFVVLCTN